MKHYTCKGCGADKLVDQYRVHKRGHRIGKCRECEREYQREWSRRDPETYRRRKRESMARRRAADPEAVREYQRKDHHENRAARLASMKAYQQRRFFWMRAVKLAGVTPQCLASMWKRQRGRCGLTGVRLDRTAQIDHILPKTRGGTDDPSNLQWVTAEANLAKRNLTQEEFLNLCSNVMRWIGQRIQQVEDLL